MAVTTLYYTEAVLLQITLFSLLIYSNIITLLLISNIRIKSGLKWSNRFGDFFLLTALSQLLQSKQNNSY